MGLVMRPADVDTGSMLTQYYINQSNTVDPGWQGEFLHTITLIKNTVLLIKDSCPLFQNSSPLLPSFRPKLNFFVLS